MSTVLHWYSFTTSKGETVSLIPTSLSGRFKLMKDKKLVAEGLDLPSATTRAAELDAEIPDYIDGWSKKLFADVKKLRAG